MFTLAKRKFEEETGLPWSDPSYLLWLEKLVEEKFTSTNKQSTPCDCGCGASIIHVVDTLKCDNCGAVWEE